MPKVITFTANLLAETTYEFADWKEGRTMRAAAERFQVGGKGINVSKMLNRFGAENVSLCFPGGAFGPICEAWLDRAGIERMAYREGCVTRSGSVIRGGGRAETTFLGLDSVVSGEAIRMMVEDLASIEEPFVFAICGSIQGWADTRWNVFRDWIKYRGDHVTLAVDNYGTSLTWLANQKPDLVKINREELELLFNPDESQESTPNLLRIAQERFTCLRWMVTNGEKEIWVLDGDGEPECFEPRRVDCVSATGCGDVAFSTLIDCLYNKSGYNLIEAGKLAAEYASRNASMEGIAEFEL